MQIVGNPEAKLTFISRKSFLISVTFSNLEDWQVVASIQEYQFIKPTYINDVIKKLEFCSKLLYQVPKLSSCFDPLHQMICFQFVL